MDREWGLGTGDWGGRILIGMMRGRFQNQVLFSVQPLKFQQQRGAKEMFAPLSDHSFTPRAPSRYFGKCAREKEEGSKSSTQGRELKGRR